MAYLGDIREKSIGPNGELWEGDNRIETRYYWNGAYIDLCDLPVEEYARTIFMTSGSSSPEVGPQVQSKVMTLEIVDGDIILSYSGAIASDLYVSITYNGNMTKTMMIAMGTNGSSGISMGVSDAVAVDAFGIGGTESDAIAEKKSFQDDSFKYQITYVAPVKLPIAYSLVLMKGEVEYLTDNELISRLSETANIPMVDGENSQSFTPVIKAVPVEGLENMNPVQITQALMDSAQDIIILTDKTVKDIVMASTNVSVIEGWKMRNGKLDIDGVKYDIWYKTANDTELSAVYDPSNPEISIDIPQDSITFIIKY